VAAPEPTYKDPLLPIEEVPELKITAPLTPAVPSALLMESAPPFVEPYPLAIDKPPPTPADVAPDARVKEPPLPLLPEPTVIEMAPP